MSMNLHLSASLDAQTKLGAKKIYAKFDLWQTPTTVTYHCLSGDTYSLYKEWVNSCARVELFPIFAVEDLFEEKEPIGYEEYCAATEHLKALEEWLEEHKEWDIEWYAL